jgi:gallate dioxygenase
MADDRGAEAGRAGARPELLHAAGGNIYFLAKIGATDGKSFQQMAGSMTGMSEEEYRDMMVPAAAPIEGNRVRRRGRRRPGASPAARAWAPAGSRQESDMARITASVYTSHVPAIGAALDLGKTASPTGSRCSRATSSPSSG